MACKCNTCKCCEHLFVATSVDWANGIYTINVPKTLEPKEFCNYCILLRTPIPVTTTCNRVLINNGTTTWDVMTCNGNYWRPCTLKCRSILKLRYFADPEHFVIEQVKK